MFLCLAETFFKLIILDCLQIWAYLFYKTFYQESLRQTFPQFLTGDIYKPLSSSICMIRNGDQVLMPAIRDGSPAQDLNWSIRNMQLPADLPNQFLERCTMTASILSTRVHVWRRKRNWCSLIKKNWLQFRYIKILFLVQLCYTG